MKSLLLLLPVLLLAGAAVAAAADHDSMQAALIHGGSVHMQAVARPVAAAGQVLVKVRFAGVNPDDWKQPLASPIPGLDGSGVVAAVGGGVAGLRVGDAVMLWSAQRATYAQYVAVSRQAVVHKPGSLSFEQAGGMAHAGLAAWNMLIDIAHVRADQSVLILGGAGGVGSAAVQIAKNRGARVIATASARNLDYLRSLGVDQVIDYTAQHFEDQVRNADIVINTVDADNAYRGLAVLRPGGFLVSVNGLPRADQCAARTVTCSMCTLPDTAVGPVLRQLADWAQAGHYRVNIDQIFPLSEVMQAWGYSQRGHTRGKSVIRVPD